MCSRGPSTRTHHRLSQPSRIAHPVRTTHRTAEGRRAGALTHARPPPVGFVVIASPPSWPVATQSDGEEQETESSGRPSPPGTGVTGPCRRASGWVGRRDDLPLEADRDTQRYGWARHSVELIVRATRIFDVRARPITRAAGRVRGGQYVAGVIDRHAQRQRRTRHAIERSMIAIHGCDLPVDPLRLSAPSR